MNLKWFFKFYLLKIRPSILIIENGHLLTMRYNYEGQDVYNSPGRNVEFGEKLNDTLQRELQEELGVSVKVGELHFVAEVISEKMQNMHFVFEGKVGKGIPKLNSKETRALQLVWIPLKNSNDFQLYPNITSYLLGKLPNKTSYLGVLNQKWF
jgi:ADP-ribose pyrophosphatase YjhB (NUDIX family)